MLKKFQNLNFAKNSFKMASATAKKPMNIDIDSLIGTAERMSDSEFEHFADTVNLLRVRRRLTANPQTELELEEELKNDLTPSERKRYKMLIGKMRNETISEPERHELLAFSDWSENMSVYRIERVQKLAALRNLPFDTVWKQMWFRKKNYDI